MWYNQVMQSKFDAGIYREYIVKNYGDILTCGGTYKLYRMAIYHCQKLSKITGIALDQIISDIKKDYECLNIEE